MTMTTDNNPFHAAFVALEASEAEALRNPTPEQAEHQREAREALHDLVDELDHCIYAFNGSGVFDTETILMLYKQARGLHDIIDGDLIGTFAQQMDEELRDETKRMKRVSSLEEL